MLRIRMVGSGSGSGILALINDTILTFLVCVKAINTSGITSLLYNFWVHEDSFWSLFSSKKFRGKSWLKIYLGQDSDPDVFESRIRIRNTALYGSSPATQLVTSKFRILTTVNYCTFLESSRPVLLSSGLRPLHPPQARPHGGLPGGRPHRLLPR
jgi:hypothetical protein